MTIDTSTQLLDLVVRRLQAISEPTRIRLLRALEHGNASVQELTDCLPATHQNVSQHLGVLHQSGIVSRQREGNKVVYSLADHTACRLIEHATRSAIGYIEELADLATLTREATSLYPMALRGTTRTRR
jgi:DNA-binding transcriptional ArsR family regulator